MTKTAVHIDADMGSDDAWTIMMALASDRLDVRSISTVFGNAGQQVATRNALSLLDSMGREDIPVIDGYDQPMIGPKQMGDDAYGQDGFGGVVMDDGKVTAKSVRKDLLEHLLAMPEEKITVLATGPLTNMAHAIKKAGERGRFNALKDKVQEIVVMGGALRPGPNPQPFERRGNITMRSEFNFFCDPAAANIVLNSGITCDLMLADATQHLALTPARRKALQALQPAEFGQKCLDMMQVAHDLDVTKFGTTGTFIHDPQTVVHLLHPDGYTVTNNKKLRAEVAVHPYEPGVAFEQRAHGDLLVKTCDLTKGRLNLCVMPIFDGDRIFGIIHDHLQKAGQMYAQARVSGPTKPRIQ